MSTAGAILKREGLVQPRRQRSPRTHPGVVDPITDVPNDLWTADITRQFRTQDHIYCYPLTIADQRTRFLLACRGLGSVKGDEARPHTRQGSRIGLDEEVDGVWSIFFGDVLLAKLDERDFIIRERPGHHSPKCYLCPRLFTQALT